MQPEANCSGVAVNIDLTLNASEKEFFKVSQGIGHKRKSQVHFDFHTINHRRRRTSQKDNIEKEEEMIEKGEKEVEKGEVNEEELGNCSK